MSFVSFLVAALVAGASARNVILEQVRVLPAGWVKSDAAVDPNTPVSFSIALKQPKMDMNSLLAMAKVGGAHLSLEQVRALRAPDQASFHSVINWLSHKNITTIRDHDMIHVQSTVVQTEKLLDSNLAAYTYISNNVTKLRTQQYSIPKQLAGAISFIHPITNFMKPEHTNAQVQSGLPALQMAQVIDASQVPCLASVNPDCIKKLYNVTYESPDADSPVRFGINGYLEENANHDDLEDFLRKHTKITNYDFKVEKINGGQHPGSPAGEEAMLDLEYSAAIGYPAAITYYATGGRAPMMGQDGKPVSAYASTNNTYASTNNTYASTNEPFLEFLNVLLKKRDDELPHVLSVSYGDDELSVPEEYARRVCNAYGLLTMRGTTILQASGDGGSAGIQAGHCRSHDGKNTLTTMPTFPASCPWVTSVGGTVHGSSPTRGISLSAGGFSYYFKQPEWQKPAVAGYLGRLKGHLDGYYNPEGRGIPDVAMVADDFAVIVNGQRAFVAGTSASTPVFAALIALVNDARLRAGKSSIGFLNEILYSDAGVAALNDVKLGTSMACDFVSKGWPATDGWDAITGLGEPKSFDKLMNLLVAA